MKKTFVFLLLLSFLVSARAQVLINPVLPAAGLHLKSQLWSLSLINTGPEQPAVKIEITLTDASNSVQVLTGSSGVFRLGKGVKQVQPTELNPIVYNVVNRNYGVDANPNGFLPIGVFTICYKLLAVGEVDMELTADCETLEIEPVSPPLLMIPFDEEHIETTRPLFSWIPPAPSIFFNNLLYDIVLVELQTNQTSSSAIQENLPIYSGANINFTTQPYPASFPELDTAKVYAWQVTAKNNSSPIAKSEIWTFRVKKESPETIQENKGHFAKLRRENDAAYILCDGILRFEYRHEINDNQIGVKIFDISTAQRKSIPLDSTQYTVRFGQNFMQIDLRELRQMTNRHVYLLEVANSLNQKWFVKFEYKSSKH